MTTSLDEEKHLDVAPEQRRTTDLVKRIRKLRWIGMEEEAAKLQLALAFFPSAERAILLPRPAIRIKREQIGARPRTRS